MILIHDRGRGRPGVERKEKTVRGVNLHKDFHGALSFSVRYLRERYGEKELRLYLKQVARNVYGPLVARVRKGGLKALRDHWRRVFTVEGGKFRQTLRGDTLVLEVKECPAIAHMRKNGYEVDRSFCLTTAVVNEEICRRAGLGFEVEYDTVHGRCVQKFHRRARR